MTQTHRHWLGRMRDLLAPPSPVHDPLDHPDLRRMSLRELDDLPLPRLPACEIGADVRARVAAPEQRTALSARAGSIFAQPRRTRHDIPHTC